MLRLILCWLSVGLVMLSKAQEPVPVAGQNNSDTSRKIHILNNTRTLTFKTIDDSTRLTIVAGDVKMRQGTALIWCDSAVLNGRTNVFEAWGKVHIRDADTADIYANHLRYLGTERVAYLDGNVKLTDGKGTLTTPDLEYNMNTNLGIYKNGGRVQNEKTVLTSQEGWYYADMKDVYFKKNVKLNDPAYQIRTDSMLYNTETKTTRFIAQTRIEDTTGRIIDTRDGYYNQSTGDAQFGQRPVITDTRKRVRVTGNNIVQNDSIYQVTGNAVIIDSAQGTTLIGGIIIQDKKTEAVLAARKPLLILKQDNDSTYITADTLFSARISDRFGMDSILVDSATGQMAPAFDEKDSTNRYFEAYHNVRIFNDSLQAASDSLFYSLRDSIFRLHKDPVVWAQNSQITGDTILLYTKNKKADKVIAYENGFMVNQVEPGVYNQISSSRIDGWFTEGNIDSVRGAGFAQCIYYIQNEDSAYTGINQSSSDIIDIYFREKNLYKVVFRSAVTGTIFPMKSKKPSEMILPNFRWLEERRPKTKWEMLE